MMDAKEMNKVFDNEEACTGNSHFCVCFEYTYANPTQQGLDQTTKTSSFKAFKDVLAPDMANGL
jgi:hypothetical protein